jgi:hypothetical protein
MVGWSRLKMMEPAREGSEECEYKGNENESIKLVEDSNLVEWAIAVHGIWYKSLWVGYISNQYNFVCTETYMWPFVI